VRLSLRAFLFVVLAIATLAPIAYLGPTQISRWREVEQRDADNELRLASASLALAVGQVLDPNIRAVTATAGQLGAGLTLTSETAGGFLRRYREQFPACLGVLIAGRDARPMVSDPRGQTNGEISDRRYYQEMKRTGRTTISSVEVGRFVRVPTIHVCAPIWPSEGERPAEPLGAVVAALSLEYLHDLAAKFVSPFGQMRALVLDGVGRVIVDSAAMGSSSLEDLSAISIYRAPPNGQTVMRDGTDERNVAERAASTQVSEQGLGWAVTVMRPAATIEEQARQARTSTLIAVFGALVLGVGFAFVVSSWLARPIGRLARYTREVTSEQDIEPPRPLRGDPREVSELTETVAAMVTQMRSQAEALRAREAEQVVLGKLRREMEIAERLQAGILPKHFAVRGFEIAASMKPAEAVGGDYYDVLPSPTGCWVAIGDVSGHGLNAGLVMLMVQSALGSLAAHAPEARPAHLLKAVNRLLVENIRERLQGEDHVTMVLMHLGFDGSFVLSGGHEPALILRARSGQCEVLEHPGPWMGINLKSAEHLSESTGVLEVGDLFVLHSDGIVEAGASKRNPFGLERLSTKVEELRGRPVRSICDEILHDAQTWTAGPAEDDMTVMVIRYTGVS
jgi:sigma-B regulation protein RsbU (phosphoserine phosphatase)